MKNKRRWHCITTDGIFTPFRAQQRSGSDPACPLCQHPIVDTKHLYWECQPMRQTTELEIMLRSDEEEADMLMDDWKCTGRVHDKAAK